MSECLRPDGRQGDITLRQQFCICHLFCLEFCFVCSCCSLVFNCKPEDRKHSSGTSRTMGSDRRAGRVRRGSRAWHPWMWLEKHEAVAVWSLTSVFHTSNFSSSSAVLDPTGAWVNFQGTSKWYQSPGLCLKWSTSVSQFLQGQIQKGAR